MGSRETRRTLAARPKTEAARGRNRRRLSGTVIACPASEQATGRTRPDLVDPQKATAVGAAEERGADR